MPGEPLTAEETRAGLWGKLPATGDFVARGLPDAFRARWDAWVTRHLAPREGPWPDGGLRLRLRSGGRAAVGLVVPSRDAVGRRYPLSALLLLPSPPVQEGAEAWCAAARPLLAAAASGGTGADTLWQALGALPRPGGTDPEAPPLLLWAEGAVPLPAEPAAPGPALDALFSSGGSPSP